MTVFRVTNTSNGAQDFSRSQRDNPQPPAILFGRTDTFDMTNFTLHVLECGLFDGDDDDADVRG